jgi:hypothetical protein
MRYLSAFVLLLVCTTSAMAAGVDWASLSASDLSALAPSDLAELTSSNFALIPSDVRFALLCGLDFFPPTSGARATFDPLSARKPSTHLQRTTIPSYVGMRWLQR